MLSTMRVFGAVMKISDVLSPTDVMIDVRTSDKGLLLRELAAKAASGLNLRLDRSHRSCSNAKTSDRPE
jgi:hypothetical protein